MAAPYHNLRSKLNRAIAAYLIGAGAGTVDDTFPATSVKPKGYLNTTIKSQIGRPEVPNTGIYRITVHVIIRGSAVMENAEPNLESARLGFEDRLSTVCDALMQSDGRGLKVTATAITAAGRALATGDDAANNADMGDFTVTAWYDAGFGAGEADAEGTAWEEVLIFEAVCCAKNVD